MNTSIRFQLTRAMLLLALVPLILLGFAWLWQTSTQGFNEALRLQTQIARQVAIQVANTINNNEAELKIISQTYDLMSLEEARQKEILLILMNSKNNYEELELLDDSGRMRVHLSRIQLSPTGQTSLAEIQLPLKELKTWYSPVHISPDTNEPIIKIIVPLITPRTGRANGLLVAHTRLKEVWELVDTLSTQFDQEIYIIDGQNNLIAHPNPSLVLQRLQYKPFAPLGLGTGLEGHWALFATAEVKIGAQVWTVVVESNPIIVLSPTLYAAVIILITIVAFASLISWLSGLLAQRITTPLLRLIDTIHLIRNGTLTQRVPITTKDETAILAADFNSMTAQLEDTIHSLEKNQAELRTTLTEKESLLRELYHRTKNNMQVISAMLEMQASYSGDERLQAIVTETQNRIRSMALVHQNLYQAQNLSQVNLKEYVKEFAPLLIHSYALQSNQVTLKLDLEDVNVLIDTAIPCGLILNELVSNALKHGFPQGRAGTIQVGLHRTTDGEITFSVADNGIGVPLDFDFDKQETLGLLLITTLSRQLNGQVKFTREAVGLTCKVIFKDNRYQPRV